MKVLLISHAYTVNENQQKIEALADISDIKLLLFVPSFWKDSLRTVTLEKNSAGKYSIVSSNVFFNGKISGYFFSGKIFNVLKTFKPDIIHIEEEPWSFVSLQIVLLSKILGLKSKIVFFTWENIKRKYRILNNIAENYFLKRADYAIAGNNEAKDVLIQKGFNKEKISVIPQLGVNTVKFKKNDSSRLRSKLGIKEFTIGFIGRFVEEKGIYTLFNAYLRLKDKAQLLLIGNGQLKGEIKALIDKYNLSSRVIIVESVNHSEIPEYMNCLDVLVLPSLTTSSWKEQFGHVIIEAFACEIPVIGSSSGAIAEVIGDAGLIFKEGNADDLQEKLELLINNEQERKKLAEHGRKRAEEYYTNKKIAEQTYNLYKDLINQL